MIARFGLILYLIGLAARPADAQHDLATLRTRAEATDYRETTRYEQVIEFVRTVAAASDRIHPTTFGYTLEGRPLPLVVVGAADASPDAVRATDKTRVFIQANIHAGEVCGKEAVLMLLRELAQGRHTGWTDSLVLLVAPIYNADGNERIRLDNRPYQNGPLGGMGQRPNAQGLDLNRDHMKLDAPESRALVALYRDYDPHVAVDLHTTNGTTHAYHLTYSPPLHPDTPAAITALLREDWLPTLTARMRDEHGWEMYYYGNLPWPGQEGERGWYTFDHRPRFGTNYAGLRNRFAILSEAYSYAPFEERVLVTKYFVEDLLDYARDHAAAIRRITAAADIDDPTGSPLTLAAAYVRAPEPVTILMGAVEERPHPYTGAPVLHRLDVRTPEQMPEFGTFAPTETLSAPRAYLVPDTLSVVRDRLDAHGIAYRTLAADSTARVERFRITGSQSAERIYEGRHARTLEGTYEPVDLALPAGTLFVPVDQPLGRLAFLLLEPRSDDGLTRWSLLDDVLQNAAYYPILRLPAP